MNEGFRGERSGGNEGLGGERGGMNEGPRAMRSSGNEGPFNSSAAGSEHELGRSGTGTTSGRLSRNFNNTQNGPTAGGATGQGSANKVARSGPNDTNGTGFEGGHNAPPGVAEPGSSSGNPGGGGAGNGTGNPSTIAVTGGVGPTGSCSSCMPPFTNWHHDHFENGPLQGGINSNNGLAYGGYGNNGINSGLYNSGIGPAVYAPSLGSSGLPETAWAQACSVTV